MTLLRSFSLCAKIAIVASLSWAVTCEAAKTLQVKAVNVRMFLQYSGELSPPLKGEQILWNVIAGDGDISEPTSAALVDVVLAGPPDTFLKGKVVELLVKNQRTGAVVARYRGRLGIFSPSGEAHVGFWLSSIGCEPLIIKASIAESSKLMALPFKCGE